ncbi:hypothetical protein GOV12_00590, partial [Candidatus Pacearchaeota archaeon]|nr:hypothetical protein [Candidatus Pacearchaeota archaeon]
LNGSGGNIESQLEEDEDIDFSDDNETDDDNGFDVEKGKGSNNLVYYIIIGIIGLLVVLVVIYFVFLNKSGIFKKKEEIKI